MDGDVNQVLSPSDKRFYLKAVAGLILCDGRITEEEKAFLGSIGGQLDLPNQELEDILLRPPGLSDLEQAAQSVTSPWVKRILAEQLFAAAFCDKKYRKRERKYIFDLGRMLGLGDNYLCRLESFCQGSDWKNVTLKTIAAIIGTGLGVALGWWAAPAIGGIIGDKVFHLSGASAAKRGLAAVGGGSKASGGVGMVGGKVAISSILGLFTGRKALKTTAKFVDPPKDFYINVRVNRASADVVLVVNGFLSEKGDHFHKWSNILVPFGDVTIYEVIWESENLKKVYKYLSGLAAGNVVSLVGAGLAKGASRTAAKALGAISAPSSLMDITANPWQIAMRKSTDTGVKVAEWIEANGKNDITLIGFSLGVRVILNALTALSPTSSVRNVFLFGGAAECDPDGWCIARHRVKGTIVNHYSENDSVLKYLYKLGTFGRGDPIGLRPIEGIAGVVNVDLSDSVKGHMGYYAVKQHETIGKVLRNVHG